MKLRIFFISCVVLLAPFGMRAASVSPAVLDLSGDRGETISSAFVVINTQESEQTYYFDKLSFTAKDKSGEPQFVPSETNDTLSKWIQFSSDRIIIPARSKAEIPFTVHVPADAISGSYQSALTVSGAPSEIVASNGAVVEAKTAVLVFFTIKGGSVKKAAILDFISDVKGIQSQLEQTYTFRMQNQGNVYVIPTGNIEVKDMFGRVIQRMDANSKNSRILPNTTRTFSVSMNKESFQKIKWFGGLKKIAIGPMTATLLLDSGDHSDLVKAETIFWFIPYGLLFVTLLIVVLVCVGYQYYSKKKK